MTVTSTRCGGGPMTKASSATAARTAPVMTASGDRRESAGRARSPRPAARRSRRRSSGTATRRRPAPTRTGAFVRARRAGPPRRDLGGELLVLVDLGDVDQRAMAVVCRTTLLRRGRSRLHPSRPRRTEARFAARGGQTSSSPGSSAIIGTSPVGGSVQCGNGIGRTARQPARRWGAARCRAGRGPGDVAGEPIGREGNRAAGWTSSGGAERRRRRGGCSGRARSGPPSTAAWASSAPRIRTPSGAAKRVRSSSKSGTRSSGSLAPPRLDPPPPPSRSAETSLSGSDRQQFRLLHLGSHPLLCRETVESYGEQLLLCFMGRIRCSGVMTVEVIWRAAPALCASASRRSRRRLVRALLEVLLRAIRGRPCLMSRLLEPFELVRGADGVRTPPCPLGPMPHDLHEVLAAVLGELGNVSG